MDKPKNTRFHLRRVGKDATKKSVGNIFNLERSVTKFGRHSGNDYFIDSSELDCFISRWHSEVHKLVDQGQTDYVIKDKSLNGTYVNNHRIMGDHILQPGEVVCFGHTNGKNLKPGDYAPQTDSEFEFVFEEVADSDGEVEITCVEENHPAPKRYNDLAGSDTLGQTLPVQSPDGTTVVPQHGVNSHKSLPQESISPVLQDISNKSSTPAGLVPLEQIALSQTALTRPSGSCNITVQVSHDKVFPPTSRQTLSPTEHVILHPVGQTVQVHPNHPKQQTSPFPDFNSTSSPPALISLNQDHLSHVGTMLVDPALSGVTVSASVPVSSAFMAAASVSPEDPRNGRIKKIKRKRTNSLTTPAVPHPGSKGLHPGSKDPCDVAEKKARSISMSDDDDDDEDDSWHYDGDKCDAFDCKKPTGAKVSWVQCDDCDGWYHIQCAHCKYGKVKRKNAEFHCGCT